MASSSVGELRVTLALDSKTFNSALAKVGSANKKAGADFSKTWTTATALANSAVNTAFTSIANKITSSLDSAIKRVDTLNNFPKVMQSLGFSSDEASSSVNTISSALDGLPTSLNDMVSNTQMLTATMGNLNKGAVNATSVGLAFNNMMLAGGQGTQAAANAFTQYNQMLAAGKVDQAAWQSVVSAAPGQINQVAKTLLGASAGQKELYEAMKEGTVSFDDFNAAIVNLNQQGGNGFSSFEEQARAATGGIGTAIENVQNRIGKAIGEVINAIGAENIAAMIDASSEKFKKMGQIVAEVVKFFQEHEGAAKALKAALVGVAMAIASIKIAEFAKNTKSAISTIGSFGKGVGSTLVTSIASLGKLLVSTVIPAVWGFTTALLANPITWIVIGIGALIAALVLLWNKCEAFRNFVTGTFEAIGNAIGAVGNFIGSVFSKIGEIATSIFQAIWNFISPIVNLLVQAFQNWWAVVSTIFSAVWNIASFVFGVIYNIVSTAVSNIVTVFQNLWQIVSVIFGLVWNIASTVIGNIINTFQILWTIVSVIFTALWNTVSSVFGAVWETVSGVFNNIREAVQGAWDFIAGIFGGIGQWFGEKFGAAFEAIKNVFSGIVGFFSGIWNSIVGIFSSIGAKVGEVVSGAFKSVINGIMSAVENILNAPIRAVNGLIDVINNIPGVDLQRLQEFNLPRMAQGGYASSATAAVFGEAGKEVALPLERNTDNWSGLLASALAEEFDMESGNSGSLDRTGDFIQNNYINRDFTEQQMEEMMEKAIRRATT